MPGFLVPSPTAPLQLMPMASVESTILVALILDSALFSSVWSCPYFTFLCLGFTESLYFFPSIFLSLFPHREHFSYNFVALLQKPYSLL